MTSSSMHPKSTLDALPKSFVAAMRTLFDVMDDKRTGYVRLADIEARWRGGNGSVSRELPSGVIDSLRKVTPANGHLSFERFCAGLRIALLRHDTGRRLESCHHPPPKPSAAVSRPASVPLPERENNGIVVRKPGTPVGKILHPSNSTERIPMSVLAPSVNSRMNRHTATVRPNNVNFVQQRAISMPQLRTGVKTYQPPKRDENPGWISNKDPVKRAEPIDKNKVSLALEKWRLMKTYHLSAKPEADDIRNVRKMPTRSSASFPNLTSEAVSSSDGKIFKV